MDLVGPISPSISQYRYILTLMDGFSRYVKTVPLRTKTAQEVAEAGTEFTAMIAQEISSDFVVPDPKPQGRG